MTMDAFIAGLGSVRCPPSLSSGAPTSRLCTRPSQVARRGRVAMMAANAPRGMVVTGNNIDLTPSLKEYAMEKIGKSTTRYDALVKRCDVHLAVSHNASIKNGHSAEVVVSAPGQTLRAEVKSETMYASIDLVADKMARILRKYKERKTQKGNTKTADVSAAIGGAEDDDDYEDIGFVQAFDENGVLMENQVVKDKTFPMPPLSVQEAVEALGFISHDFYVFRNKDTNEVNVLYQRGEGGLGHIQPEKAS